MGALSIYWLLGVISLLLVLGGSCLAVFLYLCLKMFNNNSNHYRIDRLENDSEQPTTEDNAEGDELDNNIELTYFCASESKFGRPANSSRKFGRYGRFRNEKNIWTEKNYCELVNRIDELEEELARLTEEMKGKTESSPELQLAIFKQDEEAAKYLMQATATGANINGRNRKQETPLITASLGKNKTSSLRIMKYLVDQEADVFAKDEVEETFLHKIVTYGTTFTPQQLHDVATYLVSKNISSLFNTPGGENMATPLMWMVKNLEVQDRTLYLLYENHVKFTDLDSDGDSVLKYAIEGKRSVKFLSLLIELGADWEIRNKRRLNLLHAAAYFYHVEGIKLFVKKGLNINAVDSNGTTPLQLVCRKGMEAIADTVTFMIEKGADVLAKNKNGMSAIDNARNNPRLGDSEREALVELLMRNVSP